jgi:hypothetical protein
VRASRVEPTAIVVVTEETLEVLMKVELPYTKALFDADAQNKFLSAVANSVQTAVGNLYIKSVVEKTSSRRVFRKLLAVAVEVEFAIRVPDTAAQAAMIANDGLTETKLNTELSKQAFLVSACVDGALLAATLRCAGASALRSSIHVFRGLRVFRHPTGVDHACSASNRGYPPPRCSRNRRHRRHRRHIRLRLHLSLWNSLLIIMQSQ